MKFNAHYFFSWIIGYFLLSVLRLDANDLYVNPVCYEYGNSSSLVENYSTKLSGLTWNVNLLGDQAYDYYYLKHLKGQDMNEPTKRARIIGDRIIETASDVVVLQELVDQELREIVNEKLKAAYYNHTEVLGMNTSLRDFWFNGGVVIYSRFPILEEDELVLSCYGDQGAAAVGIKYVKLRLQDRSAHIFGVHLQTIEQDADEEHETLIHQVTQLKEFMTRKVDVEQDIVLVLGDFNANGGNKGKNFTGREEDRPHEDFEKILKMLNAREAGFYKPEIEFSFDPERNEMAKGKFPTGTLDNIICINDYICPGHGIMEVFRFDGSDTYLGELSDHYAVKGIFYYD